MLIIFDKKKVPAAKDTIVIGAIYLLYIEREENVIGLIKRARIPPPHQEKLVKNAGRIPNIPFGYTLLIPQLLISFLT